MKPTGLLNKNTYEVCNGYDYDQMGERLNKLIQSPSQGTVTLNQRVQTMQIGPNATNGGALLKALLMELDLATHPDGSSEETPDNETSEGQNETILKPGCAKPITQVVKMTRVWPCLEDTDGQYLPSPLDSRDVTPEVFPNLKDVSR